jgi:hypothetical protein
VTRTALAAAYLGSILAAAYAITHVGTQYDPHGPHVLPVWPGIEAPSGVYFVGLTLVLRDLLQRRVSKPTMFALIALGAALSAFISPAVAIASGVAFLVSETVDWATFTATEKRLGLVGAVAASNAVALVVDSLIFLSLAFGSLAFVEGQIIGKAWATLAGVAILALVRARRVVTV